MVEGATVEEEEEEDIVAEVVDHPVAMVWEEVDTAVEVEVGDLMN